MTNHESFRRMVRWYPRRWRRDNGAVLLGTMLDRADHEGRTKPTVAERGSAALHGSAAHLTARLALVTAMMATALGALGGAAVAWGPAALLPNIHIALNAAAIPLLLAIALASVVRVRGWASDGTTLAFLAIGGASITLGALARVGWSQAFDAADMGNEADGLGATFGILALAGIATGTIAIALFCGSALRHALASSLPRVLVTTVLGLIGAISIAWILFVPLTAGVLSVGVVWIASRLPSSSAGMSRTHAGTATLSADATNQQMRLPLTPGRRRRALALDASSAAIGVFGIVTMATNLRWLPAGVALPGDQTARGIMILLASALPLLAALGIRQAARTRVSTRHVWGPFTLAALSIAGVIQAYRFSPEWSAMTPWLQASAVVGAVAIAWLLAPRHGAAVGIAAGLVWAAPLGIFLAPALAFAVPILAVLALARDGWRRARPRQAEAARI